MALKHEKPNADLMYELRTVARIANELDDDFGKAVSIPNDFPRGPMADMLRSLCGLPLGLATDAHPILHAADNRLKKVRYQYFKKKPEDETDNERNPEHIPPTERGQELDNRVSALRNAIGIALEECRRQEIDDLLNPDEDPWGYGERDTEVETDGLDAAHRAALDAQSFEFEKVLQSVDEGAREILNTDTANTDNFLRSLKGTENLNLISRAELVFVKGRASIRDNLADAMANRPQIMCGLADKIESGVDVAEAANKVWKEFKEDKISFLLKQTRKIAVYIRKSGDSLEAPSIPYIDIDIKKLAETKATADLKRNLPVEDSIALCVRQLDLKYNKHNFFVFKSPKLLSNFKWLQKVNLTSTSISTISPLANLMHLKALTLMNTKVANISAVGNLTQLQTLNITNTKVREISVLRHLPNLQTLILRDTQVKEISILKSRPDLKALDLMNTEVADISALENLSQLQTLNITNTKVTEISVLRYLPNLQALFLRDTQVKDITALAKLSHLKTLNLMNTRVMDISALKHSLKLRKIVLRGTQVKDITALAKLSHLKTLNLMNTWVVDISALAHLLELETLFLNSTKVVNISILARLPNLQSVGLTGTQVRNWSPVAHVKDVRGRPKNWDK